MVECPRCGSERIFGGRCLDCGEVLGTVGRGGRGFAGPTDDEQLAGNDLETSGYLAHHILPFDVPDEMRKLKKREDAAALNQPTMFSMVKAVRRPSERQESVETVDYAQAGDLGWPSLEDLGLETLERLPNTDELERARPPSITSAGLDPQSTATRVVDADTSSHRSGPNPISVMGLDSGIPTLQPAADLRVDRLPLGSDSLLDPLSVDGLDGRGLGDVPDAEIFGRYSGTLLAKGAAPAPYRAAPRPAVAPRAITAGLAALVIALAVGLVLYDRSKVGGMADDFEAGAAAQLETVLTGERVSPEALLTAVMARCTRGLECQDTRVWVKRMDAAAYKQATGKDAPGAAKAVTLELGYSLTLDASGGLLASETRTLEHTLAGAVPPERVKFGEKSQ
ncbi:MAG: hypothetical protein ACI9WU_004015 [Myxococcota bacterium]|jgi:hypothetical protein